MNIEELAEGIAGASITLETEVRTKVALPLFDLLGYPRSRRAEEFPIYGYEGRKALRAKPADILFFDHDDHAKHRKREHRSWVADHALVAVELKKPAESVEDTQGQAQFYAQWARVPFYVITNGKDLAVYRMEGLFGDRLELACPVAELPQHWARVERLLKPEAVFRYCQENRLKAQSLRVTDYADYLRAAFLDLRSQLDLSLERTISNQVEAPTFRFPVRLSGSLGQRPVNSAPQARLLETDSSVVVLAEPGGGKTYLAKMLVRDAILAHENDQDAPVPVMVPARLWKRAFNTLNEGVRKEVKSFVPGLTETMVEEDLEEGRFLLVVDGLDEAPREEVDTLYDALLRVVRATGTRVVATCRKDNYHDELHERFDTCAIDPLTDSQIEEYVSGALSEVPPPRGGGIRVDRDGGAGRHFLYRVGPDLAKLVRNPLFLMMTTAVMKTQPGGKLPDNKADLYSAYTTLLLTEWEQRRLPARSLKVDQGTKERVLAEYARLTWRRPPDDGAFNEALVGSAGTWDPQVVRDELWRSGLLRAQQGGPEFYHPSLQEYFLALDVSRRPQDGLRRFVEKHHADEAYVEVFAFLAGLLRDERRQALLLDYLERHNLYLYRRCLGTRFDRAEELGASPGEDFVRQYLDQLRSSYLGLIEAHFGKLRHLFSPWRSWVDEQQAQDWDLVVKGRAWPDRPAISLEMTVIQKTDPSPRVAIGYPSRDSYGFAVHGLNYEDCDTSSAKDFVLGEVKRSVKSILDERKLPLSDNYVLGCEYVEKELGELSSRASHGWVPRELRGLSLRRSEDEVIETLEGLLKAHPDVGAFGHIPPGASHVIETRVDIPKMLSVLRGLKDQGLRAEDFLLPPPDLNREDIPEHQRRFVWGRYSDERLCLRVGRFYDFFQQAYRWIAENLFPTFKEQLYLYRAGPIKFRVTICKTIDEQMRLRAWEVPNFVELTWEPVPDGADSSTRVQLTYEDYRNLPDNRDEEFRHIRRNLRTLGRLSPLVSRQITIGGGLHLADYVRLGSLHEQVYKQLEQDLVRDLLGDHMGRLP